MKVAPNSERPLRRLSEKDQPADGHDHQPGRQLPPEVDDLLEAGEQKPWL